ncbi:Nif3-like dinuclear metal center hexameric protein [Marinoscillum sp. MHG1-6]|uniref:Nif3-like dinuclear metal center hexameric protein n=1 Tax=Marinoscillum sp. MHG1-6 TaxID=2959627 RepID=UPI0021570DAC|nr:Nif3-like dinuclear metal center hexameric protein [Marinoscillum sp. MHG1-6]
MKLKEIIQTLESFAPTSYQESYDNAGLLTGSPTMEVSGALLTLDVTEDVIQEALDTNCNVIIAHHPLIFKGLKRLTGSHWVERCVIKAIKHDIAIYAIHTNLDHVSGGVNSKIAEMIGLINTRILSPKSETLTKLVAFIPKDHSEQVLSALYEAGAGEIGNYDHCSFRTDGTGTFRPNDESNAFIGEKGKDEQVNEDRIELIFESFKTGKIISELQQAHPYEEVAYYLTQLENKNQDVGAGLIGELSDPVEPEKFLKELKQKMNTGTIKHTGIHCETIRKVAVCGGAGGFLLGKAKSSGADIFITSDFKYHDYFEADGRIIIADIGHYESEQFTKQLLYDILSKKFTNIALRLSEVVTNPIKYL